MNIDKLEQLCWKIESTELDINALCREYLDVNYYTLAIRCSRDAELQDLLAGALAARALSYFDKCRHIVNNIVSFYDTITVDRAGEHVVKKERATAVAEAKLQVEYYMRAAEILAPTIFGSAAQDVKEMRKQIEEIRKFLTAEAK